jgi:hypothetical protein
MSLTWGGLRTYLCMQYAVHQNVAATLPLGIYIILFVMPAVLQYGTFSLVTLYFSSVWGVVFLLRVFFLSIFGGASQSKRRLGRC